MEITFIKLTKENSNITDTVINYKIVTMMNSNPINLLIKLTNVRLPFDIQTYNKNLYLNIEMFNSDKNYDDNIKKISSIEKLLKDKFESESDSESELKVKLNNISFVSSIKRRSNDHLHIKTMCKRTGKNLIITINDDIDLYKLKDTHIEFDARYTVEIKPDFIWHNNDSFGINFVICSIARI